MRQKARPSQSIRFANSIGTKLGAMLSIFALGLVVVVAVLSWFDVRVIYDSRRAELSNATKLAYDVVEQQYKNYRSGKMSEAEAQDRAKDSIRAMRYNVSDYFFVQDDHIITIVHGARPDQEGIDGTNQKDATGKLFSREMHDIAVGAGQGFVEYRYPKPGADMSAASPKLSFVRYFGPWKWTIGTGVYIDDLNSQIWANVGTAAGIGLVCLVLVGGMASYVVISLVQRLKSLSGALGALAKGELDVVLLVHTQRDEIGIMADAVQVFKEAAVDKVRIEAEAAGVRKAADRERQQNADAQAVSAREQASVVSQIAAGLEHLFNGDLMFRLEHAFAPDYEKLRANFNAAISKLQDTLAVISTSTSAIRSGTTEISTAADDLSRRTEQQAASLEETAAALDEITATVKKTSEGSNHARKVVADAKADAERSGGVVGEAIEAMSAIEHSSRKVGEIIGVIDEIAFQTNLLALNAGVEAARAGEAGRGFAVVASEVRALAQRSAGAAKEIKSLISTSGQQVSAGVILVSETGTALKRIAHQVTEINAVVLDIATSTQEQATALQEVNTAINQMDQVTQQNAAMVEQTTAASRTLVGEAEELSRLVGQFRVGAARVASRPVARRQPGSQPGTMMKITSRRGAALKPNPHDGGWEEF